LVGRFNSAAVCAVLAMVLLGVDGVVEGLARGTWDLGGAIRTTQTGRIRNYLLFAACGVAVVATLVWL
jgi:Na+/melibiose symporter-like transporter